MSELRVDSIRDELGTGAPEFPVGNIGIGKSNPAGRLHVDTASTTNRALVVESSTGWGNIFTPMVEMSTNSDGKVFKATAATNRSDMNMFEIANANGNVLAIRGTGAVTMPYQPSFRAFNATAGSGANITFASTAHNIGNHWNSSTGTFTAPIAGSYIFTWNSLHSDVPTSYVRVLFRINGSTSTQFGDSLASEIGIYNATSLCQIFSLSANDTVSLYNEGNSIYSAQYNSFSGMLLG